MDTYNRLLATLTADEKERYHADEQFLLFDNDVGSKVNELPISELNKTILLQTNLHTSTTVNKVTFVPCAADTEDIATLTHLRNMASDSAVKKSVGALINVLRVRECPVLITKQDKPYEQFKLRDRKGVKCPKCEQTITYSVTEQRNSGDEPETTFYLCENCQAQFVTPGK